MWLRRGGDRGWTTGALLACLLGAACSEKEPPILTERTWDREVARMVTVRGLVTDGENGTAVAGAEVTLPDGEQAVTAADGRFSVQTTPGRKRVEVKSSDYLRFTYELVAGEADFDSSIKVARRGPSQEIGMTGGTLTAEEAVIEVPPGAYPNGSSVSITALKRSRVSAVAAPAQFVDDQGVPRRVVGVVAMEGSSNPSVPLRVRTPVSPDATIDTVQLHRIDARGEWTDPKRPESIAGGMATFAVSDDGQYGVTMDAARSDAKRIGYVVTDSGDSAVAAGSVLTGGSQVVAGKRVVSVVDPRGAAIEVAPNSLITLDDPAGANGSGTGSGADGGVEAMTAPYAGRVRAAVGEGRVVIRRSGAAAATAAAGRTRQRPGGYLLMFWLPGVVLGADGGAFTFTTCAHGPGSLDTVGAVEGLLHVFFGDAWATLAAGQSRVFCPTCQDNTMPQCGEVVEQPRLARLAVSPPEIPFDDLMSGEVSPPRTITVTNAGNGVTAALVVQLSGGPFEVQNDGCTAPLAAGASCQLSVLFRPTAAGNAHGEVTISSILGGTASVTLAGQGLGPPQLSLVPGAFTFPPQASGRPGAGSTTFVVHNEGDLPTGPLATTLEGGGAPHFQISRDSCTAHSLAPRAFCEVDVVFSPLTTGQLAVDLVVSGSPGGQARGSLSGRGLEPALLVASTRQVTFGDQLVGTLSEPRTVDISNAGEEPTGPIITTLNGSAQMELGDNGCEGAVLAPGASCQLALRFRPASAGPAAASLDVAGLPGGAVTIDVAGRGLAPARLSLSPPSAGFDDQVLGTASGARLFTVTNQGDVPTGPLGTSLTGTGAAQFQLGSNDCAGQALPAHVTCSVEVVFSPTEADEATAVLLVSGTPGDEARAELRGRALAPAALAVSPGAVSFPDQLVGTTGLPAAFTFTNLGDVPSGTVAVVLGGAGAGAYQIIQDGCGAPLAPKTSCAVTLTFRPTASGTAAATVTGSATPGSSVAAALVGRGLAPAHLVAGPAALAYGDVLLGSTGGPRSIVVTNQGDVPSGPIAAALGGVSAPQYQIDGGCQGLALGPGASCTVAVTFAPTLAGDASASVFFQAAPGDAAAVALSGRGVRPAHLVLNPTPERAFEDTLLRLRAAGSIEVLNDGDVATGPLAVSIGGATTEFGVDLDQCGGVALAPGQRCTVMVAFTPTIRGVSQGTFTVTGAPGGSASTGLRGRGLAPANLVASPGALAFVDQLVGTPSGPQAVAFTNDGDVASGGTQVSLSGPAAGRFQIALNGCNVLLQPQASCTVTVVFRPDAAGAAAAVLNATALPGGSLAIPLTGRGLAPAHLAVNPPARAFGDLLVGTTSAATTFTLVNDGDVASGPVNSGLGGVSAPQFQSSNGCQGRTLAPGASCTVSVTFAPTVAGDAAASLFFDATPGNPASASLSGRGLAPAHLTAAPPDLAFPDTLVGGSNTPVSIVVSNDGDVPSGVLAVTGGGGNFPIGSDGCSGQPLAAHSSCAVAVGFLPAAAGASAATVTITGAPGGSAAAHLSGRGLAPARLNVSPPSLAFGSQLVATTGAPSTVTFSNDGDVPTGTLAVALGGAGAGQYQISANGCAGGAIAAKGACTVTLLFAPTAAGSATATIAASGTPGGSASASLGGTGLAPAHLVIAPPAATFGDVLVGASSAPTTFTVTNDGDVASGPLLSGLGGVSGPQYHVESNGCEGVTLGPKASCSISVVLAPTAAGDASAGLFVNASPGGSALASLSGRGQAPAHLVIAPPGIVFPDQLIGGSSPETPVTVTNDGDVPAGALVTGLTGLAAAQFQIGANGCAGVPLAGHSSCTVGLIFRPTATGDSAASFTVTGAPGGTAATNLGGRGLKPASLAVTPPSFTFPDLPVGQESQPQVFTFSNGGDVPTGPLAVVTGGPGAPQYRIQNDGCSGLALPPHASCTTAVTFAPTAPGDVPPAALAAAGNPGGSTSASLGARALGPAHLRIEPPELFFGSVPLDAVPPTMTFTVFNDGDEPSGLPDGFLEGPGAPFFDTPNLPPCAHAPLPPHGSCAVDMRFHPGAPGETSALLTVRATPGGDAFINLRGIGLESARLTVSPDQFDFGPVPLGQSRQTTFVVTNSGVNPAGTVGVSLEGPDVPEFAIVDDACTGRTLAPGETCPLTARFAPHQSGFRSVTLTVRGSESGGVASSLLRGSSGEGGGTCTPDSCGQGLLCCGSFCADPRFDQQNCGGCGNTCPAGQFCNNGICGCSPMQADCNGVCTFLQGDPDNCGACGNTCPPGNRFCGQGPAGPTCQSCTSANMVDCNNRCVDLRHDQQNCGACGQACAANQACIEGACVTGTCSLNCGPGSLCCEGGVEGGGQRCTDPRFDAFNCGGCGVVCGPNRFCNNGVCGCQPGQVDCNGVCTFLQGDPDNCGACGNTCPIGSRFCGGGTMPPPPGTTDPSKPGNSCQPCSVIGQTECGGRCVDIHSDQNNCGTCGSACGPNQGCVNGTCVTGTCATSCGPGSICCTSPPTGTEPGRDLCVSPNFDQNNCGACGNVCGGGRFCQNGVCACNPMQVDCNGACTNVFGDPDNCGSCGHVCPAGSRYCSGFVREGEPCQPCSAAGQTECGGRCVDTQNDQGNCGACGVACAPNQACVAGACVSGTCAFTCGPGAVCCQGGAPGTPDGGQKCSDLRFDQTNCGGCGIVCGPNHFCNNGVCGCQPGLVECNGACTYPFGGDPDNCGACGTICPEGSRLCGYGPAGLGCYACDLVGQSECNGRCVDMQTDSSNCGACGNPCGPNQACVAGACVSGTCALSCGPGALCCSIPPSGPEPARDSCVPPLYDPSNCGGCGIVCGSGKFCQNGACTCPGGQIDCQGVCAFVGGGDPDHCGSCQTVCPPGNRFCGPGPAGTTPSCQPCASSGQTECNGRCADTHTDQANCGACGQSCAPGQACVDGACISGSCALSCPGGWICCGPPDRPFCSDPHYDYGNCGACGNVCGPGQFCNNGQCSCGSAGLTNCNGVCRDLRYDPDSCGTCGNVCPPEARFCVADPNPTCRPCPGPGQALCDGRCTDTRSDRDNCGACGTGCGDGNSCLNSACVAGTCSISCGQGSICCGSETGGQFCVGPGYDRNNCGGCGIVCPDTQSCISGVCGCQSYEASCGGSCTYLPSDANNCGACGNVCPAGSRFCNGGRCQPCSVIGQSECDGRCLDLQNDAANCGACGNACGANQACVSGRCIEGTCPISCGQGAICCGSEATGQFCAGPGYDRNNCGGCGIVCPDTQSCISGTCGCQSYEASCDGTCSYLPSDPHNCGACGHLCPAGSPFCSGGQCQPCSAIGQSECNGRCIDLPNDPANCGACGNACGANQACAGGRCIEGTCPINCGQGAICCGSEATGQFCAGPGYDRNNCGGCGIACADTQSCISGTCGCQSYEASCSGVCSYLPNDANNCGACGHVCPEGSRFCSGGQCQSCASIDQTECNGRCVDSRNDPANCGTCGTTCQPNQACVNSACVGGL